MSVVWAELRQKYEEMLALRRIDDPTHDPRPRLAALASRFPGALREIDRLPEDEIVARIEALARAERDPAEALAWMHATARFHALARAALSAKRKHSALPAGSKGARSPLAEARRASATSAEGELEGKALEQDNRSKGARSPLAEARRASATSAEGELEGVALERDRPHDARPFDDDPRVANPPRGRLMDLVYEKLAAELGTTPEDAKRLVFG